MFKHFVSPHQIYSSPLAKADHMAKVRCGAGKDYSGERIQGDEGEWKTVTAKIYYTENIVSAQWILATIFLNHSSHYQNDVILQSRKLGSSLATKGLMNFQAHFHSCKMRKIAQIVMM